MEEDECSFKTEGKHIHNLSYTDKTTMILENAKNLQVLVMKVKEHNEKRESRFQCKEK